VKISIVISTLHRADSLRLTLAALRFQSHDDFEAIVVEGPSEVGWGRVASEQHEWVRRVHCPDENLARSRNLGLAAARGEVVAFIDDDAVPEPRWLEELAAAYEDASVTGAGGIVFDNTGIRPQYGYALCDRLARPDFGRRPPFSRETLPGADPFLYLQGTNMSFRRDALIAIGGFDEQLIYLYDDADICLRMIDAGARLRALGNAAVHHRCLASPVRRADGLIYDPFAVAQGRAYFALRHGPVTRDAERSLLSFAQELRQGAITARAAERFTDEELERFMVRLEEGLESGRECALGEGPRLCALAANGRAGGEAGEPQLGDFSRYPLLRHAAGHPRLCLLSPAWGGTDGQAGGDPSDEQLARSLADKGHEVHWLRACAGPSTVHFDGSIWTHGVMVQDRALASLADEPAERDVYAAAAYYHEVQRLHEYGPVDMVVTQAAGNEGLVCSLDGRFATGTRLLARAGDDSDGGAPVQVQALADRLARLAHMDSVCARQTATELLDRASYPFDLIAALLAAWAAPPGQFVEDVFRAALGREPDPHTRAVWQSHIEAGHSRHHLLADALGSDEARERGIELDLLARFRARLAAWAPVQLRRAWALPDRAFVAAAYQWTLGRSPDAKNEAIAVRDLGRGVSRIDVLARLTESAEARDYGMPAGTIELVRAALAQDARCASAS
jgi:GT2 family glycosyltransferase